MRGPSRLLAGLLAALPLLGCGERPQADPGGSRVVVGPVTNGLSIHARLDTKHGLIPFDIVNESDETLEYVDTWIGYHEGVALDARRVGSSEWTRLRRRTHDHRIYHGMGPTPKDQRRLAPGARMPRTTLAWMVDQRRFAGEVARPGLEVPVARTSFVVDLLDFVWPDTLGDLEEGDLELRVVQGFPDWSELLTVDEGKWVLPSAVLTLDLGSMPDAVRTMLERS